jgi:hypothetical protein
MLSCAIASAMILALPQSGWALTQAQPRHVGRLYWELVPETEVRVRLIPEDPDGKPPLVNLVLHAFFPGRAERDPRSGLPQWPKGAPARLTISAEPLPSTVIPDLSLQLVIDGRAIDLTGPGSRSRNLPCLLASADCTPNAVKADLDASILRSLITAGSVGGKAPGFRMKLVAAGQEEVPDPPVAGLDHVPVAVRDLEAAAAAYRRLGFALKPGRPHENGIRNQHVKFADGTAIELITAAGARDALTAEYRAHLARGDGAVFVSLFAPDLNRVARAFDAARRAYRRGGGLLSFPSGDPLRYVFFGGRTKSPTDRPEHFRHPNGAEALVGVWIAADGLAAERALLAGLGAIITEQDVNAPEPVHGAVARFALGDVVLLPGRRQLVQGRPIVGATIRVRSLDTLRGTLTQGRLKAPPAVQTMHGRSVFLAPDITHGIWLEFREAH